MNYLLTISSSGQFKAAGFFAFAKIAPLLKAPDEGVMCMQQ